jgi:transposase-like protein
VTSDAHAGLVAATAATLPDAAWQRCRTHYAANLMAVTPKSSWGWVKALLHSVYDQPDAEAVHAQFDRILDARSAAAPPWSGSSPTGPRSSVWSARSWPSNTTNGPKAAATSDSTS